MGMWLGRDASPFRYANGNVGSAGTPRPTFRYANGNVARQGRLALPLDIQMGMLARQGRLALPLDTQMGMLARQGRLALPLDTLQPSLIPRRHDDREPGKAAVQGCFRSLQELRRRRIRRRRSNLIQQRNLLRDLIRRTSPRKRALVETLVPRH